MLEIGCGNLRAGLFIGYLDAGNYYGVDISPEILLAAQDTVTEFGLQEKLPHLALVRDMKLAFLPAGQFDVVHAHSVFSHCPASVIDECLDNIGRIMAPGGFFDFTFDRTSGAGAPGAARGFLLPDGNPGGNGGQARPDGPFHG